MTEAMTRTIGVDFDGVIHQFPRYCPVGQPPVPGAIEALHTLMRTHAVFIFCARRYDDGDGGGLRAIPGYLQAHQFRYPVICDLATEDHFWTTRDVLLVTNRKIPAVAYIDDRALRFDGDWDQTLKDVEALTADAYWDTGGPG